jgi:hypothetical protein
MKKLLVFVAAKQSATGTFRTDSADISLGKNFKIKKLFLHVGSHLK